MIDLRSDTVTLPTPEMRDAIARAELGDDVYREDPTVNRLEELAAEVTGKQAALLVASGTMANLIALMVHCPRGRKAIVGSKAHSFIYEAGGASVLGGIAMVPVANLETGALGSDRTRTRACRRRPMRTSRSRRWSRWKTPTTIAAAWRCRPRTWPTSRRSPAATTWRSTWTGRGIFNAAIALETDARTLAGYADSVSFCLSKGLACPVGSLLCGSREFIAAGPSDPQAAGRRDAPGGNNRGRRNRRA